MFLKRNEEFMPQFERQIESINKKILSIEKNLDTVTNLDKRLKVVEAVNSKLIAGSKDIEKISKKLSDIDERLNRTLEFEDRLANIERDISEKTGTRNQFEKLINQNIELKVRLQKETEQLEGIKRDYVKLQEVHKELEDRFVHITEKLSSISFDDLTIQFKDAVESFNKKLEGDNEQSYFIDNLDIELKTGLEYGNKLKLVQALAKKDRKENISTIKFSLKPKTNLKITD